MVPLLPFFAGVIAGAAAVSTLRNARRALMAEVSAAQPPVAAPPAAPPPAPPPADSHPGARRRARRPRKSDNGDAA